MSACETIEQEILDMFAQRGDSLYGGEAVTQLEHALQAATFAERAGAAPELILAALLHDVGHLLHDLPDNAPDQGIDDLHEELGARWLAERFPTSVLEPVRMHVEAKRYLCATDPQYRSRLSSPSEISLQLQGGPMTKQQCADFRRNDHFEQAIQLRRWDDQAKISGYITEPLQHFLSCVRAVAAAQVN